MAVNEDFSNVLEENLVAYMLQFANIVSASYDSRRSEWRYNIMIDKKASLFSTD